MVSGFKLLLALLATVWVSQCVGHVGPGKHLLNITLSGYLPVGDSGQLFFIYYEAQDALDAAPILVWLQVSLIASSPFTAWQPSSSYPRLVEGPMTLNSMRAS